MTTMIAIVKNQEQKYIDLLNMQQVADLQDILDRPEPEESTPVREVKAIKMMDFLHGQLKDLGAAEKVAKGKQALVTRAALFVYLQGDWKYTPGCNGDWGYFINMLTDEEEASTWAIGISDKLRSILVAAVPKLLAPMEARPLRLASGQEVGPAEFLNGKFSQLEALTPLVRGSALSLYENPLALEWAEKVMEPGATCRSVADQMRKAGHKDTQRGQIKFLASAGQPCHKYADPATGEVVDLGDGTAFVYTLVARTPAEDRLIQMLIGNHVEIPTSESE